MEVTVRSCNDPSAHSRTFVHLAEQTSLAEFVPHLADGGVALFGTSPEASMFCFVDSKLSDKERPSSRSTSRKHREAKNLLRSSQRSKEDKEKRSQPILSQTSIGWDEDFCARYDAIAAEDHSYIGAQAERSRNENSWKLVLTTSS